MHNFFYYYYYYLKLILKHVEFHAKIIFLLECVCNTYIHFQEYMYYTHTALKCFLLWYVESLGVIYAFVF